MIQIRDTLPKDISKAKKLIRFKSSLDIYTDTEDRSTRWPAARFKGSAMGSTSTPGSCSQRLPKPRKVRAGSGLFHLSCRVLVPSSEGPVSDSCQQEMSLVLAEMIHPRHFNPFNTWRGDQSKGKSWQVQSETPARQRVPSWAQGCYAALGFLPRDMKKMPKYL